MLDGKSGDFRLLVSGLELWQFDPLLWRAVWARGRTFTLYSNVLPRRFSSARNSLFLNRCSSPSNRQSRQANCSGRLTFQIHMIMCTCLSRTEYLATRAFLGALRPHQPAKPKSTIEERNKAPACFRIATLRLSYLFVYIANPYHRAISFTSAP